ncbi:MAG: FkbM family methyltransferase [Cyclobacteriaceae bacterium]|nr:FkbM family methyltransferase [Cyclobacteriaceae bacterium]
MRWSRIPFFLWPLVLRYYGMRLLRMQIPAVMSNWVYFLKLALPNGIAIKKTSNQSIIHNPRLNHTVIIRPGSSDVLVYLQIFFHHEYEKLNSIQLAPKPVVVDMGANAGFFMLLTKNLWADARVFCVEPDAKNCNQIEQQVTANKISNVEIIHAGVWIKDEPLKIISRAEGMEWALAVNSDPDGDVMGISFKTLLLNLKVNEIDLLKIDIEGTEELLFENYDFMQTLSKHVKILIMETHNSVKQNEIASVLRVQGFEVLLDRELILAKRSGL